MSSLDDPGRVSRPASHRILCTITQQAVRLCRLSQNSTASPPTRRAHVSRLGDDLASLLAPNFLAAYVQSRELLLAARATSGLGPKHNERNHR
jgi:hypothetical protein